MCPFRGTDEQVEQEITILEAIRSSRVRRYARDLAELERDLRELKRERTRRLKSASEFLATTGTDAATENGPTPV